MTLRKFINKPENITSELLEGLALANPFLLEVKPHNLVVNKGLKTANRVTIVTLGGSGHEPAFEGFVGEGMIDVAVVGDIFAAPGYKAVLEALRLADKGKGIVLIVLNHASDMLAGTQTLEEARRAGIAVSMVVTREDVAYAPRTAADRRRGLVGCVPLYKIVGAAAAQGKSLQDVTAIAQDFADNMATIAVACKTATHPQNGSAFSVLGTDEMEIGMGQHGEGGGDRQKMKNADETAILMTDLLITDLNLCAGEEIMVIVNGTGSTTIMEMLIIFRCVHKYLSAKGIRIVANWVEEVLTVQEQAGFQLFFARMNAQNLWYWNAPARTPYLVR
ncbi:dihydroxyacetone kinase subunit DhaK [Acetobacterium carbinolicum]|jgi:Dihydroxyacetone kinase|uniref:dihydroxyacetone kinase subunit DhaK n=1 Tax=Acetobacterium TaxID=33951 RepID=UPI000DBEAFF9|nr:MULTISPECIES: dihydroxyacetone kinase subunit DhaK [unclassified Acetobacterium]AWW26006.1 glycerol kinase [Acetobacterium sp. KB-1]MDK2942013.1 phosphoenolpyruvate---glycerone phosphotransferase subunit DhaK [Acetobacterium sp.]MDZ5723521.1 dihydroxyacetone kinase subunit DhaK [Acetobacterium sp. K1/6]